MLFIDLYYFVSDYDRQIKNTIESERAEYPAGTKNRQIIEEHELQAGALWQDMANQCINNPNWSFAPLPVLQLQYTRTSADGRKETVMKIDPGKCPPQGHGVTGECVRLVFVELKSYWTSLDQAVNGKTGCNSTGEDMYGAVWRNYVNGKYLYFRRPVVAMYLFKLWNEQNLNKSLPKYCDKKLSEGAAVQIGANNEPTTYTLPMTPRSNQNSNPSTPTTATTATTSSTDSMNSIVSFLSQSMIVKKVYYLHYYVICCVRDAHIIPGPTSRYIHDQFDFQAQPVRIMAIR